MQTVKLPGFPFPLHWHLPPAAWAIDSEGRLSLTASEKTDWFISPEGNFSAQNAAALLFDCHPPAILSARVTVNYASLFDAGALVVYQNPTCWAKLCLELSPLRRLMIVSVVTKEVSDDSNAYLIEGNSAYLRISCLGKGFAFHASADGKRWNLIRHFALGSFEDFQMGFLVQAPTGAGCTALFEDVRYLPELLPDIRSGA